MTFFLSHPVLSTIYYLLTPRKLLPVRGRQQRHGHAVSPPLRVRPRPRHQQQRVRFRSLREYVDKYGKYLLRKIFSPIKYLHSTSIILRMADRCVDVC